MKLIKFTTVDGREHFVNPSHIIELTNDHYQFGKYWNSVRVMGGGGCTTRTEYRVDEETYKSILEQLKQI